MVLQSKHIDRLLYTELNLILWDVAAQYITEQAAFHAYETRWKYVDESRLNPKEKALIAELIARIGKGLFLAA